MFYFIIVTTKHRRDKKNIKIKFATLGDNKIKNVSR